MPTERREDGEFVVEIDEHGQGFCRGPEAIVRAYWACGVCGEATGGPFDACPDHPSALRFRRHDRIPVESEGSEER